VRRPVPIRPPLNFDKSSVTGAGLQLEISAIVDGVVHPLLNVLADEDDESLWLQVHCGEQLVQIPLALARRLIDEAPGIVFSEARFDRECSPPTE
jgi:hypothetical protein